MSLPRLSPQFFKDISPSPELWENWGHKGNWSETLVPLYVWESVLFVGVPPGRNAPAMGFAFTVVEAPVAELKEYFKKIQSSSRPIKIPAPVAEENYEIPDGLKSAPMGANDNVIDHIFKQLSRQFSKSMLLRKEGNALTPWQWDSHFQSPAQTQPITLGVPSPFRIVQRTMRPYHGYVVPGEVQEKFFDEWNSSQIPDHLTIAPIVANDEVLGMLLCVGEKNINPKASLELCENMAAEIVNKMGAEPNLMAS